MQANRKHGQRLRHGNGYRPCAAVGRLTDIGRPVVGFRALLRQVATWRYSWKKRWPPFTKSSTRYSLLDVCAEEEHCQLWNAWHVHLDLPMVVVMRQPVLLQTHAQALPQIMDVMLWTCRCSVQAVPVTASNALTPTLTMWHRSR